MSEILLKDLENIFFPIMPSEQRRMSLLFVDYHRHEENLDIYQGLQGPDIFTKSSTLNDHTLSEDFKKQLFDEYVEKIIPLSIKNRENSKTNEKFDIDIDKWEEEWKISPVDTDNEWRKIRKIVARLNSCSSYIAVDGRIGPSQFVIMNQKTYDFLQDIVGSIINDFGYMGIHISDKMEDGNILLGRKNEIHNPGVVLVIKQGEDKLPKRIISEEDPYGEEDWNDEGGKTIDIIKIDEKSYSTYDFVDIGFFPEKQFYMIKIK